MIHTIDKSLERFLRGSVPLPEDSIDVSFDAPDRTWGAAVTRPTINVFLWDIRRNTGRTRTGIEQRINGEGGIERRRALPVVDLHYLLTAWATEPADEHQLLGSLVACVLSNDHIAPDALPPELADVHVALALSSQDSVMSHEFWSSLDGRMKPGLQLEVSLPIEAFRWTAAAAPAEEVGLTVGPLTPPPVTTPAGTPRSGPDGAEDGGAEEAANGEPPLRRRRSGGSLMMEGRADKQEAGS